MSKPFLTIADTVQYETNIKKSRFICSLAPVATETAAKQFIADVVAANPKANHNCFAYLLGNDDHIQRESDNGEPAGTAGVPILEVLKRNELHNTVAVVTRYFGGIKLGAGGLIRAYSGTTAAAIEKIGIVAIVEYQLIDIQINYAQLDSLNYFLATNNIVIKDTQYTDKIIVTIAVPVSHQTVITDQILDLLSGNVTFQKGAIEPTTISYDK